MIKAIKKRQDYQADISQVVLFLYIKNKTKNFFKYFLQCHRSGVLSLPIQDMDL